MIELALAAHRFYEKVDTSGGEGDCWEWRGSLNPHGYGHFYVGQRTLTASRAAWEIEHGHIPEGLCVCHRCDNPRCVNPSHLFLGNHTTNIRDCVAKGRRVYRPSRGDKHYRARMTEERVREIRNLAASGETQASIGRRFDITQTAVSAIVTRRNWKHVR